MAFTIIMNTYFNYSCHPLLKNVAGFKFDGKATGSWGVGI